MCTESNSINSFPDNSNAKTIKTQINNQTTNGKNRDRGIAFQTVKTGDFEIDITMRLFEAIAEFSLCRFLG